MKDDEVINLTPEQFHKLAYEQCVKYPDLLKFGTEKDIIKDFYNYYARKLKDETGSVQK